MQEMFGPRPSPLQIPGALSVTAFWNIRDPVRYRFGNRRRCNGAVAEGVTEL